jgi:hypothetical protein
MRRGFGVAQVVCAALVLAPPASASERDACIASSEAAQRSRAEGKFQTAREKLLECVRATCPTIIRTDCDAWLQELTHAQPTVVFSAQDAAGRDLTDVRVLVDGVEAKSGLDGMASMLDPGPHTLRFEHAGSPAVDERVVIREAEKGRPLSVRFAPQPVTAPAVTVAAAPPLAASTSGERIAGFVVGGVGIASLAAFAGLAIKGQSDYESCKAASVCLSSQVSTISAERAASWTTLGIGVASLGIGAFLVIRSTAPRTKGETTGGVPEVRVGILPSLRGVLVGATAVY